MPNDQDTAAYGHRRATTKTPQIFVLLVDNSGSMAGEKANAASELIKNAVATFQEANVRNDPSGEKIYFYLQVIRFGETAEEVIPLKSIMDVDWNDPNLRVTADGSATDLASALQMALATVQRETQVEQRMAMPEPVVLVVTDGMPNVGRDPVRLCLQYADQIKAVTLPEMSRTGSAGKVVKLKPAATKIVALGVGQNDVDENFLRQLVTESVDHKGNRARLYLLLPDETKLAKIGALLLGSVTQPGEDPDPVTLEQIIATQQGGVGAP